MPWINDTVNAAAISTLDLLEQAALLLGQDSDDEALFDTVLAGIGRATGASRVVLYFVDPAEGDLLELASLDEAAFASSDEYSDPPPKMVERALAEGQAQIEDVVNGLQPALVLPLLSGSRTTGLIFANQLSFILTDKDLLALQALANLAAAALERDDLLAALEELEQAQRDFVSLMTHEIRVPLTSISGYADLMLNGVAGTMNDRQDQFMRTIRRNVDRLNGLINDLGDLNRVQDGRMPLDSADFDLKASMDAVLAAQADAVDDRGHDLSIQLSAGLPKAFGDDQATKRVFEKILVNAIRYTPEGGSIIVGAVQLGDRLQVTVADNGIGISQEDRPRMFEPFFRSDVEAVRDFTGWGLSLALAKALIEVQNGELWFESEPGAGSVFHFTLPVAGTEIARPDSSST
jgi:signal transduction histidine kinase